jgi:hypothetical protein
MNRLTVTIAAGLIATAAGADDIYNGFAEGNPDLRAERNDYVGTTVVQPGVGDSIDRYQGWADGNSDLFQRFDAPVDDDERSADVYKGFRINPEL